MITSFRHKGLEKFFTTGSRKGIQPEHAVRLQKILTILNAATQPEELNYPGAFFHELKGAEENVFSVRVNGNWRVTFRLNNGNAEVVDYLDYH